MKRLEEKNYDDLIALNVSIGRYFEGYTTIEIDFVNLKSIYSQWGGSAPKKVISQTLSSNVMAEFKHNLMKTDFVSWDKCYENPDVYEGTRFSIELVFKEFREKKYGQNKFPQQWSLFCELVENLALNHRNEKS